MGYQPRKTILLLELRSASCNWHVVFDEITVFHTHLFFIKALSTSILMSFGSNLSLCAFGTNSLKVDVLPK